MATISEEVSGEQEEEANSEAISALKEPTIYLENSSEGRTLLLTFSMTTTTSLEAASEEEALEEVRAT